MIVTINKYITTRILKDMKENASDDASRMMLDEITSALVIKAESQARAFIKTCKLIGIAEGKTSDFNIGSRARELIDRATQQLQSIED